MNPLSSGLNISSEQWLYMLSDVSSRLAEEACGMLAGEGNQTRLVIPITNTLHDPYRFLMDAREELFALQTIEEKGYEILAIYHSHPNGLQNPSPTDYAELTFPGIIYLILYQDGEYWHCRGYLMQGEGEAGEVPVIISNSA